MAAFFIFMKQYVSECVTEKQRCMINKKFI
jgi:hypothetical protein